MFTHFSHYDVEEFSICTSMTNETYHFSRMCREGADATGRCQPHCIGFSVIPAKRSKSSFWLCFYFEHFQFVKPLVTHTRDAHTQTAIRGEL